MSTELPKGFDESSNSTGESEKIGSVADAMIASSSGIRLGGVVSGSVVCVAVVLGVV